MTLLTEREVLRALRDMPHGMERAKATQAYIRQYCNKEKRMPDFCATVQAAKEQAPSEAVKRILEGVMILGGCGDAGPIVTPQSGGGGTGGDPTPPPKDK